MAVKETLFQKQKQNDWDINESSGRAGKCKALGPIPSTDRKKKANFIYMTTSISKEEIEVPFGVH
jgi:hypothetical protein